MVDDELESQIAVAKAQYEAALHEFGPMNHEARLAYERLNELGNLREAQRRRAYKSAMATELKRARAAKLQPLIDAAAARGPAKIELKASLASDRAERHETRNLGMRGQASADYLNEPLPPDEQWLLIPIPNQLDKWAPGPQRRVGARKRAQRRL